MTIKVPVSKKIVAVAKEASKESDRTVKEQLEHWIKIAVLLENNPHLTYAALKKSVKGS